MVNKCILMSFVLMIGLDSIAGENKSLQKKEKAVKYEIVTQETKAQPALVIKGKVKLENAGEAIGGILGKIATFLEKKKVTPVGAPFTRTFDHSNGFLEFEAGFPIAKPITGEGDIIGTELPKAKVATAVHKGSQEKSVQAYEALHAWMKTNGKKEAGAPWESYLTDPATTPDADSKIEIFYPIQ